MLSRVTSASTNDLMQAQVAAARAGGARVISVMPRPEQRVGLFDTEAMPALVELGRRCAADLLGDVLLALQAPVQRKVARGPAVRRSRHETSTGLPRGGPNNPLRVRDRRVATADRSHIDRVFRGVPAAAAPWLADRAFDREGLAALAGV